MSHLTLLRIISDFVLYILSFVELSLYPLFDPINAYVLVGKRIMAGVIFKAYLALLSKATIFCFDHKRSCCFLGEWLIVRICYCLR